MKKFWFKISVFITFLLTVSSLQAHVVLDHPEGGETFFVGDTVNIKWHIFIEHNQNNWDLYFSPDGGRTWQTIQLDLPVSQLNYQWIIPDILTDNAQIQILMDNVGANYVDISSNFTIAEKVLGVKEQEEYPKVLNLVSNFPNPFNPSTTIKYEISQISQVKVVIYDMLGREIRVLDSGIKAQGIHSIIWNGVNESNVPIGAGVYFYQIQAGDIVETKKMVLLK
jgi:hypothetical protein